MKTFQGLPQAKPATYLRRKSAFIHREFQLKHSFIYTGVALLGMILIVGPTFYLLEQNFSIFLNLAYQYSPDVLDYLEREQSQVTIFIVSVFLGLSVFSFFIGFRLSERMAAPIQILGNHLKELSRGKWSLPPVRIRDSDEFHDLIDTYNYFYKSFRINQIKDYERLKKLSIDPANRDAHYAWTSLLEEKSQQLGLEEEMNAFLSSESDVSDAPSHDSQRAS